jgi:tRNA-splicing ligase RtcB
MHRDPRLNRIDATRMKVLNNFGIDTTLFAADDVPVEAAAVTELLQMMQLKETVERIAEIDPASFEHDPVIERIAVTPDFHKAAGIPVGTVLATRGFVVPRAIGNDINCGMRVHVTSLRADEVVEKLDELETACRRIYFEGGRNIPMSRSQREAMFMNGLLGLLDATPKTLNEGQWSLFHEADLEHDLARVEQCGSLPAKQVFGLNDFMGPTDRLSRDSQIGSIGGGNHFVEIQRVERILDGPTAHAWGLKLGLVTVMVHTGSVAIGHLCGSYYRDVVRKIYPASLKHPENGIFILPQGERHREQASLFWDAMYNAANFAFANRLFLGLMALSSLREVHGELAFPLLYDAPHNFLWRDRQEGEDLFIHRKGACPARNALALPDTPFQYHGEPVFVPGSMGANSFILVGQGNAEALWSASHGAGRSLSRGEAARGHEDEFRRFMETFRVVTPVDFRRPDIQMRRDILDKKLEDIKQEAPYAYKGIGPIVETLSRSGIARPVAELSPLMTIKG